MKIDVIRRYWRRFVRWFVLTWVAVIVSWESYSGYQLWYDQARDEADARAGMMVSFIFGPIYISVLMVAILLAVAVLVRGLARMSQKNSRISN